jgi:hypothetical protein
MGFLFTKHIITKFTERPFTTELLANIINNPDKVEYQEGGKIMASKVIDGYLHRLAYRIQGNDYVLITYYSTSKVEKYC